MPTTGSGARGDGIWCPECGEGVAVDEDGCCATCEATTIRPSVVAAIRRDLFVACEALRAVAFHRSACPAHAPGVIDGCDCGYDEAEELAHVAIQNARAS